jgi:heme exporter protein D
MFDLGPHAGFIWLSYGAAALCITSLIIWAWAGERAQRRRLADLERRGLRRRSSQEEL